MPIAISVGLAGALGAAFGSFLNVVAYRVPRRESLLRPRSRCPDCGTPISGYDNVPVISWALLRGRCRRCQARISPRYPAVEALTAGLAIAAVLLAHSTYQLVLSLTLILVLVPVAVIDLDHRIIPNRITLPAAIAAIVIGAALKPSALPGQLLAGCAAGGFLLAFALAYPRGMGIGDVKLACVLGLYLGASVAVAILVAVLAGTAVGALVIARVGVERGRKTAVPFGPFLALGGVVAALAGTSILHWYLHTGL